VASGGTWWHTAERAWLYAKLRCIEAVLLCCRVLTLCNLFTQISDFGLSKVLADGAAVGSGAPSSLQVTNPTWLVRLATGLARRQG